MTATPTGRHSEPNDNAVNYFVPQKHTPVDFDSMTADSTPLDVLIVGAGPVGMATALGLVRRGIRVTIVEAQDQVSFGSRAICISRHSLEIADRLGFGPRLERLALPWSGGRSFYRQREILRFAMPHAEHDVRGPMVNVSQSELEQLMLDDLTAHPLATIHWSARVVDLDTGTQRAVVGLDTQFGPKSLHARWVVAADGGRSSMRELAGLRMAGTSYQGSYVIADIHWPTELPTERRVWFDPPGNPGSTIIMHRQPHDIWRIDYQLDPEVDAEYETNVERIRERITEHLAWLDNTVPWTLQWHGFYRAHALALDEFVHGPILFVGDAAHLVPIFGVRGLNSGMEDADTLAWQLAAVIHGTAEPALLDIYAQERRDAWKQNVHNAGRSTLIMAPGTDGYRTTRDAVLKLSTVSSDFAQLINPRQSSATHARTSPLTWTDDAAASGLQAGDPLPDRKIVLAHSHCASSLSHERGAGFTVLVVDPTATDEASLTSAVTGFAAAVAPESVTVVTVERSGSVRERDRSWTSIVDDGSLAAELGGQGRIVVVRPDGLIQCRLADARDLASAATAVTGGSGFARTGTDGVGNAHNPVEGQNRREEAWLSLSAALDAVPSEEREGFLTRLALVLGASATESVFAAAIDTSSR